MTGISFSHVMESCATIDLESGVAVYIHSSQGFTVLPLKEMFTDEWSEELAVIAGETVQLSEMADMIHNLTEFAESLVKAATKANEALKNNILTSSTAVGGIQ